MDSKIQQLIGNLSKRNIEGIYVADREGAHKFLLDAIPDTASIGFCGSETLEQLEIIEMFESRGNNVMNQYSTQLSRDESMRMRKLGTQADFYLTSANAIAATGELVFLSAFGHRIAGISDAKNVIVVCGVNKITESLPAAIKRAREHAAPLNCQRLQWDTPCFKDEVCHNNICLFPDYNRMCCQMLVIEAEVKPERLKVVLVNETLGF
jgi:hypothetical protein